MNVPTTGQPTLATPAGKGEVAVWTVVVLAASLLVYPGLGILIAAVLAFTRLRHNPKARWVLLGVSVAVLIVAILGLMVGTQTGYVGPSEPA
jgi:hypothetical protein